VPPRVDVEGRKMVNLHRVDGGYRKNRRPIAFENLRREGMKSRKGNWIFISYLLLLGSLPLASGCSSGDSVVQAVGVPQWTGSGFLREEFLRYKRVAILPFEGDPEGQTSDTFLQKFHTRFPEMILVRQSRVLERFQERDLYYGRLDKVTRSEIRKVFNVQAVVMGSVSYPSILRWLLQVVIVDTETDTVLGRSYVEINFLGAEGMPKGCELAVQSLIVR